jgi:3-deoxy-7-phosphoheptulonate synthase
MKTSHLKHVHKQDVHHHSLIRLNDRVTFGTQEPVALVAGPCAVESYEQLKDVAMALSSIGIFALRGGVFKPRTSPYSFQGLREEGLEIMQQIGKEHHLALITEIMAIEHIAPAVKVADCLQIGARNMQNFELLKAVGRQPKPVLLKRGLAATVEEFLLAAEYIMAEGNMNVILCERGIRSFDSATRNVLALASVALIKERTHLPIIVDPSHSTGVRSLVTPAALAGVAVGADGIIVEAHPNPEKSVSDADQALSLPDLALLTEKLKPVAMAVGRQVAGFSVLDAKEAIDKKLTSGMIPPKMAFVRDHFPVIDALPALDPVPVLD